jgi:hypothetical protein
MTEVRANLGLVLRGDIFDLKTFSEGLDRLLIETPTVRLVHRQVSASRLWLKEGDDMNETGSRKA